MTDIVERLRTFPNSTQREHDLQREAAAEIEQLRKNENWQMTRAMKAEAEIERLRADRAQLVLTTELLRTANQETERLRAELQTTKNTALINLKVAKDRADQIERLRAERASDQQTGRDEAEKIANASLHQRADLMAEIERLQAEIERYRKAAKEAEDTAWDDRYGLGPTEHDR